MNAVVDTNVVAYYLLMTEPFAEQAGRFWRAVEQAFAPAFWEAELANVVWMAIRKGILSEEEGHQRLDRATRFRIHSVPARRLYQAALTLSLSAGVSVYDTLFVELAVRQRLPLVTFDAKLLKAFPNVARRPAALL